IFWPMPVDPSVSRRFSIFTRVCSALSSSLSKPTSSFKTSSLVVLCSCRLIASSAKNSRKRTSSRSGRTAAKRNGWLLVAQRVITLCLMHFPYPTGQSFPLFLAPMSGVAQSPFRLPRRRLGADVLGSEFISAVAGDRGRRGRGPLRPCAHRPPLSRGRCPGRHAAGPHAHPDVRREGALGCERARGRGARHSGDRRRRHGRGGARRRHAGAHQLRRG